MTDIQNRSDLELLMAAFYDKLLADDSINYIFTDVAKIDLPEHLPHIVDFWELSILHTGNYKKNVMQVHLDLNHQEPLTRAHFETWLGHFHDAVDEHFSGQNAELIKTRALSVATVMQIKMQHSN
ncbi:group III truncated hemoglobin [Flavobacterium sp.]|uniref:group III truncated hemoglobin n=1 Tax=Flavobacterium sp. TaxID=239 RepID=UPI0039E588B1